MPAFSLPLFAHELWLNDVLWVSCCEDAYDAWQRRESKRGYPRDYRLHHTLSGHHSVACPICVCICTLVKQSVWGFLRCMCLAVPSTYQRNFLSRSGNPHWDKLFETDALKGSKGWIGVIHQVNMGVARFWDPPKWRFPLVPKQNTRERQLANHRWNLRDPGRRCLFQKGTLCWVLFMSLFLSFSSVPYCSLCEFRSFRLLFFVCFFAVCCLAWFFVSPFPRVPSTGCLGAGERRGRGDGRTPGAAGLSQGGAGGAGAQVGGGGAPPGRPRTLSTARPLDTAGLESSETSPGSKYKMSRSIFHFLYLFLRVAFYPFLK